MKSHSIRTFIGAKNFEESRAFYNEIGFEEIVIDPKMSYFKVNEELGFYLQDYYVKDWVNNSMIFLEVENVEDWQSTLKEKELHNKFNKIRFSEIKVEAWGSTLFMHDPSGILWHFTELTKT